MTSLRSMSARRAAWWRPAPRWLVVIAFLGPTVLWLASPLARAVGPPFLDWGIYASAFERWRETGSLYLQVGSDFDPFTTFPYLYPPSSWPLPLLAAALPAVVAWAGILPVLWLRVPLVAVAPGALLLAVGLGNAVYLANVNLIVAGLLVVSLRPGRLGGIALGAAIALKAYPLVLLPLLWRDRSRLTACIATLAILTVSGTLLTGVAGWADWFGTLISQGDHPATSFNPFQPMGIWRLVPATAIALAGIALRSPTIALLGATWSASHVSDHYLVTFVGPLIFDLERVGTRLRGTPAPAPGSAPSREPRAAREG